MMKPKGWLWYLPKCDRCKETAWTLMMSIFNYQRCCRECIEKEKKIPTYKAVRGRVMTQLSKGTNKFPVINIGRQ